MICNELHQYFGAKNYDSENAVKSAVGTLNMDITN